VAGFGRPGKALPEPEKVAKAYELYQQLRSYRYVGEALGISHEAARRYVLEAFHADRLRQGELTVDGQSVAADELDKARVAGFLEGIAAAGIDRYDGGGGKYELAAPVALKAVDMYMRMKGYYAPTSSHHKFEGTPPAVPDTRTQAIIDALDDVERHSADRGHELLSGNEEP
jgi:hypothetical protein